jgi:hypothetical protein
MMYVSHFPSHYLIIPFIYKSISSSGIIISIVNVFIIYASFNYAVRSLVYNIPDVRMVAR